MPQSLHAKKPFCFADFEKGTLYYSSYKLLRLYLTLHTFEVESKVVDSGFLPPFVPVYIFMYC